MAPFDFLLFVFYWLFIALVSLRIIFRGRNLSTSLAWLLIIYIIPLLGALLYFFFGELQLGKRRAEKAASMRFPYMENLRLLATQQSDDNSQLPNSPLAISIQQLLANRLGIGALHYNNFKVLNSPEKIFDALLTDIRNAKESIRMEFYIWNSAGRVKEIEKALLQAHQRGVKIQILIDDAGSWFYFFTAAYKELKNAGIEIIPALSVSPWRLPFRRADIRMHRKMVIIDHQMAYTGSMNMADPKYFNKHANVGEWVDAMVRFEGSAAQGLSAVFSWDWEVETEERDLPESIDSTNESDKWLAAIPSGPGLGFDLITQVMLCAIYRADQSITICSPYFVPPEPIFEALVQAAKRGIKICILVPRRNDSRLVSWASKAFYDQLLQAGAEIMLFKGGLLHTKAMLIDEELAIFGSVNLDVRSLQLNFEISLALFDPQSCREICDLVTEYKADSESIDAERWHQRSLLARLRERLVFFLSPLL
ncbi:cardiolipin synthase [Aliidiomarina minuta]|uniref:Cardiolipin synthase n=1 Tax=Aliidiomarina minuta TaxID=880057 RepID=A0A432W6L5_9GAMM|nr:cardiolipin synthase [Aliidiomarina minuta]RUO25707.1 cardiolipin synthase [Aliidiomarina minuta]